VLASVAVLLCSAAPASARDIGSDDELVINGTVRIPRGQHADRIVIADGRVEVNGAVDGDVISLSQRVTVDRGATLNDDLVYVGKKPVIARGANINGEVRRVDATDFSLPFGAFVLHAALWLAFTLSTLVLGLVMVWLAPGVARAVFTTARERAGPAVAWGLGLFLTLPLAAAVALLTVVGIPLGLVLGLAMFPLYSLGYVATGCVLGRAVLADSRGTIPAFLAGWGILRAIAFVPVLGVIAWVGATVFGLGLLAVALWRSRGPVGPGPVPASTAARP
jgi:hypothetical protein